MNGGSVLWAETPDEGDEEGSEPDAQAHIDETFAARRLRRWIKGMFGGKPAAGEPEEPGGKPAAAEPEEPGREPDT